MLILRLSIVNDSKYLLKESELIKNITLVFRKKSLIISDSLGPRLRIRKGCVTITIFIIKRARWVRKKVKGGRKLEIVIL